MSIPRSASAACVLPTPSAPSPAAQQLSLPPIWPHPLPPPSGHSHSRFHTISPRAPGVLRPSAACPGKPSQAAPALWLAHTSGSFIPGPHTRAHWQISPCHPVMSNPNGDGFGPFHPKVPEPPFPTPQASASQHSSSPWDPSLQAGRGHGAELPGGGQVWPSPRPGAGGGPSEGMAGQGPLPNSPPGRAVLLLSQ